MNIFKSLFSSNQKFKYEILSQDNFPHRKKITDLISEVFTKDDLVFLKNKRLIIHIPENQKQIIYELANDDHKSDYDINGIMETNGHVALPKDDKATEFNIVFNKDIFDDLEYFSTVTHELNHIIDYSRYFNDKGNVYLLDKIRRSELYYFEFYFWTEFKSKRAGVMRQRIELEKSNFELSHYNAVRNLFEDLKEPLLSVPKYYKLMHFFAKISAYDDKYLRYDDVLFPLDFLRTNFCYGVDELYKLMSNIDNYEQFDKNKENIRRIIGLK